MPCVYCLSRSRGWTECAVVFPCDSVSLSLRVQDPPRILTRLCSWSAVLLHSRNMNAAESRFIHVLHTAGISRQHVCLLKVTISRCLKRLPSMRWNSLTISKQLKVRSAVILKYLALTKGLLRYESHVSVTKEDGAITV